MHRFEERSDGATINVERGAWVKVGLPRERFWGRVLRVRSEDGALISSIDNDLVHNSWLKHGDVIELRPSNILESANESDLLKFLSISMTRGPRDGAVEWQSRRLSSGMVEVPKRDTVFLSPNAQQSL